MKMNEIVSMQHEFFKGNQTKSLEFRKAMLRKLYHAIEDVEEELFVALKEDLNKSKDLPYSWVGRQYC